MTAERSAAFDIVDAIMKEREAVIGYPDAPRLRTRREWERFVEDAIGGAVVEAVEEASGGDIDW